MENFNKLYPREAAIHFLNKYFPSFQGALLAGSVVRDEATDTSELNIVIFDNKIGSAFRESLIDYGLLRSLYIT